MTQTGLGAGGYDWLATWRRMYDQEREQAEQATAADSARTSDPWAAQAQRFSAATQRAPQPDGFMQFVLPHLRPTDVVLDIGAGTGRYEPTLARSVRQIVAVEPSASMRAHLEQRLAEGQIENVEIVPISWPEAEVPLCDVAISAHVVYAVREIGPFLQRLDTAARRVCFLYLAFQHPSSFISPFWEHFRGEARLPLPGALECLNALYQLGIPAHLAVISTPNRFRFVDEHEALADIRWRLRYAPDPTRDAEILAAIHRLLERDSEGLQPRGQLAYSAVLWWAKDGT